MKFDVQTQPNLSPTDNEEDCLIKLVKKAENTKVSVDDNPGLTQMIDRHILLESPDEIELMCQQCPVTCTIKDVGSRAIALLHDTEACIENI